ncbi:MAG: hypothetical protein IT284_02690 [Bacteroidetes bacterium]|nr:hypothetical protein [Bacteroidota bacterium]
MQSFVLQILTLVTPTAYASLDTFIRKVNTYLINPAIALLIIVAVVYFLYGVFEYVKDSGSSSVRETGSRHMLWGLIGLFIMVGVFFIMRVLLGTFGIDQDVINPDTQEVNIPPQ